jgi:hypothetical protein
MSRYAQNAEEEEEEEEEGARTRATDEEWDAGVTSVSERKMQNNPSQKPEALSFEHTTR